MSSTPPEGIYRSEDEASERRFKFVVRDKPLPIPPTLITDEPLHCAKVNVLWLAHILGALEALNQPDAWQGGDTQQWQARQQIEILMNQLKEVCEEMNVTFQQVGCLLQASVNGGATWTTIYDVTPCLPDIPDIPPVPQFRSTDCTLEVSNDGGATWTLIFDASCAEYDPPPDDVPEDTDLPPVVGNPSYCAGAKYLTAHLFDVTGYIKSTWEDLLGDLQLVVAALTLGLDNLFKLHPAVNTIITASEWYITNEINELESWLVNADNRQEVECLIYCAAKSNQGFNEGAWSDIIDGLESGVYPPFASSPGQYFSFVTQLIVGYKNATKKFKIGALNDDNTCEAECIECADQDWVEDVLGVNQLTALVNGEYPWWEVYAGDINIATHDITTDQYLIHVMWDFSEFDTAIYKLGIYGSRRIIPLGGQLMEAFIKVRRMDTGEWVQVWERETSWRGVAYEIDPGFYFDAIEFYCPQPFAYGYNTGDFMTFGGFTIWGKRKNPFTLPPEE